MRRTSARVSRPAMPGTFQRVRKAPIDSRARQLLGSSKISFTTNAERYGRADSSSSGLIPTLPICV